MAVSLYSDKSGVWEDPRICLLYDAVWAHYTGWEDGAATFIQELADLVAKEHDYDAAYKQRLLGQSESTGDA